MIHPLVTARKLGLPRLLLPVLSLGLMACSEASMDAYSTPTPNPAWGDDDSSGESDGGGSDPQPTLPPESGDAFYRTMPAATDRYVFVVNPERDTLSKINASSRAVYTLDVGTHPTQVLTATRDPNRVLVLNEGDATLSIIDAQTDAMETVSIHQDTNFMAISPDGLYAITYFDANVEGSDTSVDGVRSYSNISVVYTGDGNDEPTSTPVAVGMNPRSALFVPDMNEALVLCDDLIAQVSLSQTPTVRLIKLTDDIDEHLTVAEMKLSPDGRYLFVRLQNIAELMVVDLRTESSSSVSRLPLNNVPSDMDISGDELILVDRSARELLIYSSLDPSMEPQIVKTPDNQLVGSIAVSPESGKAILYTTLTAQDLYNTPEEDIDLNRFSVWDLSTDEISLVGLVKPVAAVSINQNPALEVATIIHDGNAHSEYEAFDREEAFSQYYFDDDLVVPTVLESPIKDLSSTPDSSYEYLILEDNLNVVVVDYAGRQVNAVAVQSTPVFVGILTGSATGYVSQEHELGRISFIEPTTLTVNTITGFELNSQP